MRRDRLTTIGAVVAVCAAIVAPAASAAGTPVTRVSASVSVCAESSRVTSVVVTRRVDNPERFSFPGRVKGADATAVRALARAICGLPDMPPGVFHCPADTGPSYRVVFSRSSPSTLRIEPVTVEVTGCTEVVGAGPVRRVLESAAFYRALGAAVGLAHASRATFLGVFLG